MKNAVESLIREASKDIVILRQLKELSVKHQKYELAANLRELERANFPIEDKNHKEYKKAEMISSAIGLVDLGQLPLKTIFIFKQLILSVDKMKDKFDLKTATMILSEADEIFGA